ncbi:ABC transporter ATP-binding protein [Streptomyces sp. NRRL F-5126]|uniref:ABC transporter ATP-binding protein n=1 Tax=Streptomyces sp. NRRL F-5126 TaxID=1463857 RepID=UPI0004C848F8|nr:ABC transporter ATP-binding protein [Streptomyces sp. NRRL F-5126]
MSNAVIRARGLAKRYGDAVALRSVDLDVQHGEIFSLLGPNGAGKTTTTEIMEGFRTRDAGELSVLGEDPARAGAAWRGRIGIVLQQAKDFADISVADVVHHFAVYYANPRDPDEVIEAVGLTEKRASRAAQLSGGQRRRLDVALGILGNPELLFLDEPTTGFDPEVRRRFWELIAELRSSGTTILLTTHYLDEVEYLADRVGVVDGGTVVDVSTPDHLGGRHLAPSTVRWVGPDGPQEQVSSNPTRTVGELARHFGGDVPELTVTRPSLEDVYLQMIGES